MKAIADEFGEEGVGEEEDGEDQVGVVGACGLDLFAEPGTHYGRCMRCV